MRRANYKYRDVWLPDDFTISRVLVKAVLVIKSGNKKLYYQRFSSN